MYSIMHAGRLAAVAMTRDFGYEGPRYIGLGRGSVVLGTGQDIWLPRLISKYC